MIEILLIAFGAIGVGFLLILLLAMDEKRTKKKRAQNPSEEESFTQKDFERACVTVVERMKLNIEEIERTDAHVLEIKAKNPAPIVGGDFFVYCIYLPRSEIVTAAEIIEVSNMIIQDRLSKGILMTNTRFTDDLPAISELAPLEFIDGARLQKILSDLPMI